MIRRCEPLAAALIVSAVLAGCTHLQPGSDELSYGERRDYLTSLEAWALRGRIAVDTGERAFQGRFQWAQDADALALTVRGPLGTNVLRVSGPAEAVPVTATAFVAGAAAAAAVKKTEIVTLSPGSSGPTLFQVSVPGPVVSGAMLAEL